MTPAAQFAQKRDEAIALIRTHAPARLHDALIELLRPAIALSATRADDSAIPLGASKFGGAPDVPEDFVWPTWNERSLGFLAQINLEEVAPFDLENLLPKSGLLSFFYDLEETPWGEPQHQGSWRVYFFEGPLNRGARPNALGTDFELSTASITPRAQCTINSYEDTFPLELEWGSPERVDVSDLLFKMRGEAARHHMFGHTRDIQGPPGTEAAAHSVGVELTGINSDEFVEKGRSWLLLLQVESDYETLRASWGDMGTLYFMIRPEDLAAKRFDQSWLIMQC